MLTEGVVSEKTKAAFSNPNVVDGNVFGVEFSYLCSQFQNRKNCHYRFW
jgi:hypothetical protein